eukprot:TRINITY_DN6477_c0_g1_i1.p1 TRINITY_DN6477_c0_g1~~TRINITY_DN6477_c0_g1_i1.p1  ORF type:complete len:220 (+),score=39.47 TRINITY_DN6477_c0_g1_i1:103-762(+)
MRRFFGGGKKEAPAPTLEEATKKVEERGDSLETKIKKLDAELVKYREQLKKTRPGPAQEGIKQRALRILKQKKMYEGQRDMLMSQAFNMEQTNFAIQSSKDTVTTVAAMKAGAKELKSQFKHIKIEEIETMQDTLEDLLDESNDIQELMGRSYGLPDDVDEDSLEAELEGLSADLLAEEESETPSYLSDAPSVPTTTPSHPDVLPDGYQLPPEPQSVTH